MELEQNVKDTITLTWIPSTDEKLDDRLRYMVMKRDSVKQTWRTVADNLFNHKFTIDIMQGREYYFRVFAKNDMGLSEPSVSPTWGTVKKKGLGSDCYFIFILDQCLYNNVDLFTWLAFTDSYTWSFLIQIHNYIEFIYLKYFSKNTIL